MHHHFDHTDERFGSASWSQESELRRTGLFERSGLPVADWNTHPLRLNGDAPMLTVGGAGSGKLRDLLGRAICTCTDQRLFVLDPRGELYAISWHNFIRSRAYAYCWNPTGLHSNPQHRINPLDILTLSSPTFHSDAKFIAEALVPLSESDSSPYFPQKARQWIEALMKSLVERFDGLDFPMLRRFINMIESDPQSWANHLEFMLGSWMDDVARTAAETLNKQSESPKEFSSIMGTIYASLGFLDDPTLLRSLENPNMSLADLATSPRPVSVFLNVPIEFISLWAPLLRVMFTVTMLYKERHPQAPRITMITDEAGQMGRFEALLRSFTFGRGAGVRSWAIFQDIGQIERNFGRTAVQGFMGSAQLRQFFGVRDYQTALLISHMLGQRTLRYDDGLRQSEALLRKKKAAQDVLFGGNPFQAALDYRHFAYASEEQTKAARWLLMADEVLSLPEHLQILFISGKNLKPVLAQKRPYYDQPDLAGFYLPNPYHPPLDSVPIAGRMFRKSARVITERIPPELAAYPQYQDGYARYVEGYRPF